MNLEIVLNNPSDVDPQMFVYTLVRSDVPFKKFADLACEMSFWLQDNRPDLLPELCELIRKDRELYSLTDDSFVIKRRAVLLAFLQIAIDEVEKSNKGILA